MKELKLIPPTDPRVQTAIAPFTDDMLKEHDFKEIMVNPSSSLSLQKHKYRSEHWIVIKGIAKVQINENKISLTENQSTYIPLNTKHRLSNEEDTPLIVIEVQCGTYLGEDDIYRYDDNYGRKN